jgi:hypothetical protein
MMAALVVTFVPSLMLPCCRAEVAEPAAGADSASTPGVAQDRPDPNVGDTQEADEDCSNADCGNCVNHARCFQNALPHHLLSCDDKRAIINSTEPAIGSVAIMNVGPLCHVGYVYNVQGSGPSAIISIEEANYHAGVCGTRQLTAAELKIIGYFRP